MSKLRSKWRVLSDRQRRIVLISLMVREGLTVVVALFLVLQALSILWYGHPIGGD